MEISFHGFSLDWNMVFGVAAGVFIGVSILVGVFVLGWMIIDLIDNILINLRSIRRK
jgi:hypothetical protein